MKYEITFVGRLDGAIGIVEEHCEVIDLDDAPRVTNRNTWGNMLRDESEKHKWVGVIHEAVCKQVVNEDGSRKYEINQILKSRDLDTDVETCFMPHQQRRMR
tara:strand:+ start:744 stop:1049 length:306 start_codon:yes stop_codon:yes gene_type:complete